MNTITKRLVQLANAYKCLVKIEKEGNLIATFLNLKEEECSSMVNECINIKLDMWLYEDKDCNVLIKYNSKGQLMAVYH